MGQFSVLNFFLLSLLSLAFVLGFDIKKMQREYCNQDFMNSNEVLWQKKKKIQKEMWYQKERNKEISVLKKTKSLSCILGKILQELDVLTILVNAQRTSKREEQKHYNDDRRKRMVVTFIQSCW